MSLALDAADLPADAVEVGRIADAWGIKGWFKVLPHSASPEALFSSKRWYLQPPERPARATRPRAAGPVTTTAPGTSAPPPFTGTVLLKVREAKAHADTIVAWAQEIDDRNAAEALRGARIFVPRSSFPSTGADEFYWVDLIGLAVVNREGLVLGQVKDLMATGPQTVLVVAAQGDTAAPPEGPPAGGQNIERMIPFVRAYIDQVDLAGGRITVDWQPDY